MFAMDEKSTKSNSDKLKILLVDDHPMMRDSLRRYLEKNDDFHVVAEATNGLEAVQIAKETNPDVIIMDVAMPELDGIEATRRIKLINPNIMVLILTVHSDNEYILKILESGADGYLLKNIAGEKIGDAIYLILAGESVISREVMNKVIKYALKNPIKGKTSIIGEKLSNRELQILRLAAKGLGNKQIAQNLELNLGTVKGYFVSIFAKLHVNSRTEAVIVGIQNGYITLKDIGLEY